MIVVANRLEASAIQSMRRRPEMATVKAVLERELIKARAKYESTVATELDRERVDTYKALINSLFVDALSYNQE